MIAGAGVASSSACAGCGGAAGRRANAAARARWRRRHTPPSPRLRTRRPPARPARPGNRPEIVRARRSKRAGSAAAPTRRLRPGNTRYVSADAAARAAIASIASNSARVTLASWPPSADQQRPADLAGAEKRRTLAQHLRGLPRCADRRRADTKHRAVARRRVARAKPPDWPAPP